MNRLATPFLEPLRRYMLDIFIILGQSDEPVTGQTLADELGMSISSVEIYMRIIKISGYIKGVRGVKGGYVLDADPKDITVIDIIGKTITTKDDSFALSILAERTVEFMDAITLQDLLDWDE